MSNVSRCFFCANKIDFDPKHGYFGCNYSGQECKEYSMFEPKAKPKPMTNADRIRAMSDEELATMFANVCPSDKGNRCCQYYGRGAFGCKDCWLDWLKAEEGET